MHNLGLLDLYLYPYVSDGVLDDLPHAPEGKLWITSSFGPMGLRASFPADPLDPRLLRISLYPDGAQGTGYATRVEAEEMLAWSRWQLGWLDATQISCVTENEATVTLSPVAEPHSAQVRRHGVRRPAQRQTLSDRSRKMRVRGEPPKLGPSRPRLARRLRARRVIAALRSVALKLSINRQGIASEPPSRLRDTQSRRAHSLYPSALVVAEPSCHTENLHWCDAFEYNGHHGRSLASTGGVRRGIVR